MLTDIEKAIAYTADKLLDTEDELERGTLMAMLRYFGSLQVRAHSNHTAPMDLLKEALISHEYEMTDYPDSITTDCPTNILIPLLHVAGFAAIHVTIEDDSFRVYKIDQSH
jgi:hypothetical protein